MFINQHNLNSFENNLNISFIANILIIRTNKSLKSIRNHFENITNRYYLKYKTNNHQNKISKSIHHINMIDNIQYRMAIHLN